MLMIGVTASDRGTGYELSLRAAALVWGLAIFTDIDVVQSSLSKIIMPIILRTEFGILISSVAISFSYSYF